MDQPECDGQIHVIQVTRSKKAIYSSDINENYWKLNLFIIYYKKSNIEKCYFKELMKWGNSENFKFF